MLMQLLSLKRYPLPTSANPYQIRVCWYWRYLSFIFSRAWFSGLGWTGLSLKMGGGRGVCTKVVGWVYG